MLYNEPMKPTGDKVLVEVDPPKEKTASGLYIQEEWKTLPPFGTVKAIGPDVQEVKVGDRILFNRYAAVQLDGNDRLITEKDILATVNERPRTD